jgi:hypothetical protein
VAVLDGKLSHDWATLAAKQQSTTEFIAHSTKRPLDEGNIVVFYNTKLVSTGTNWGIFKKKQLG